MTKVSPCSYGDIVPASVWRYGSSLTAFTLYHALTSSFPRDAAAIHFPIPEITPQVTKINFIFFFMG